MYPLNKVTVITLLNLNSSSSSFIFHLSFAAGLVVGFVWERLELLPQLQSFQELSLSFTTRGKVGFIRAVTCHLVQQAADRRLQTKCWKRNLYAGLSLFNWRWFTQKWYITTHSIKHGQRRSVALHYDHYSYEEEFVLTHYFFSPGRSKA